MVIFNSYVKLPEGKPKSLDWESNESMGKPKIGVSNKNVPLNHVWGKTMTSVTYYNSYTIYDHQPIIM